MSTNNNMARLAEVEKLDNELLMTCPYGLEYIADDELFNPEDGTSSKNSQIDWYGLNDLTI